MTTRKQIMIAVTVFIAIATLATASAQTQAKSDDSFTGTSFALINQINAGPRTNSEAVITGGAIVSPTSPLSETPVRKVTYGMYTVSVSGYSSEVAQTDANPFITASGTHVRDGVVAANMFPIGTVLKMPSLYGDKIFIVEDRMNARYQNNVDIWFASKTDAIALGRRTVKIEVIR